MVDDLRRTIAILVDSGCGRTSPIEVGRLVRQPFNAAVGAGKGGRDGLLDFVCQRSRHLPQRAHTIGMCQIGLELTQSLALSFCTFAAFNVREGSVPLNNLSMLVPKWDTTHQKPSIFPVSC